jgi:hypothetical protein
MFKQTLRQIGCALLPQGRNQPGLGKTSQRRFDKDNNAHSFHL